MAPILLGLPALPSPAQAAHAPGALVSVTSHALQLTISIPKRTYPRYAVVKVHATVTNVSNHTIWLAGSQNAFPGISNPQPEVLSPPGKVVYPPAFKYLYPLPGPYVLPQPLHATASLDGSYFVILRDTRLRLAVTYTTTNPRQHIGPFTTVHTSELQMRLTPAQRPTVTTHLLPVRLSAVVQRPTGAHGSLLRVEYSDCPGTTENWTRIDWSPGGTTLKPDCATPEQWHVIAGWIGFSVVRVDFAASARQ